MEWLLVILALGALGVAVSGLGRVIFVPARRRRGAVTFAGGLAVALAALVLFGALSGPPRESAADRATRLEAEAAVCRQDLDCWAERHRAAATAACRPEIERLARFRMEWTHGALGQPLTRYAWAEGPGGALLYLGDAARFETGFGAFAGVIYACTFDPDAAGAGGGVLRAEVEPGRLD